MVADVSLGQAHEAEITLRKAGATPDFWTNIAQSEELAREVVELVMAVVSYIIATYKVAVDYGQSLAEMIKAGNYDWVNNDITQEHFPVSGQGKQQDIEVALFHFNKVMKSDQVIARMRKEGYRPATIAELLALGVSQPELQKQFPIIALGSVWRFPDGGRLVPCLGWLSGERSLGLGCLGGDWLVGCRFVGLRNA